MRSEAYWAEKGISISRVCEVSQMESGCMKCVNRGCMRLMCITRVMICKGDVPGDTGVVMVLVCMRQNVA